MQGSVTVVQALVQFMGMMCVVWLPAGTLTGALVVEMVLTLTLETGTLLALLMLAGMVLTLLVEPP